MDIILKLCKLFSNNGNYYQIMEITIKSWKLWTRTELNFSIFRLNSKKGKEEKILEILTFVETADCDFIFFYLLSQPNSSQFLN